jgi:ubiquinone/menaquinone biosynthesis C-methylase UbiE
MRETKSVIRECYDRLAPTYDDRYSPIRSAYFRRLEDDWFRRKVNQAGQRVLDLGTGTGRALLSIAAGARLAVGIDLSEGMIRTARAKVGSRGFRFLVADAEATPFREGSFDLILAIGTLEATADLTPSLREAGRLLSPGGRFAFTCHNRDAWFPASRNPTTPYPIATHSIEEITRRLGESGLRLLMWATTFFFPGRLVWPGYGLLRGRLLRRLYITLLVRATLVLARLPAAKTLGGEFLCLAEKLSR